MLGSAPPTTFDGCKGSSNYECQREIKYPGYQCDHPFFTFREEEIMGHKTKAQTYIKLWWKGKKPMWLR